MKEEDEPSRSPTPLEETASSSSPIYELDDLDAELGLDDADAMMPLHTIVDTPEPVDDEEEEGELERSDEELDYEEDHVDEARDDESTATEESDGDGTIIGRVDIDGVLVAAAA